MNSIQVLLSFVANQGCSLFQFDVKNVFLDGILKEVSMKRPPGVVYLVEKGKVCKLKKERLEQSLRALFKLFENAMVKGGYR